VGDIIMLSGGQKTPADGYIINGEVLCNQAHLTGESIEQKKCSCSLKSFDISDFTSDTSDRTKLFGGSIICSGSCEMVVAKIGNETLIGNLAKDLQESNRPSPLKKRLGELAKSISYLGYVGAVMIAFAYLFNVFVIDSKMNLDIIISKLSNTPYLIQEILHAVTIAVSVIVVAVPEGLPMMITVVLSSNMKKMLNDGVLVRRLVGIETAGNLNILFTDKTGTLTTGKMAVSSIVSIDGKFNSIKELKTRTGFYSEISTCIDASCGIGNVSSTEQAILSFFINKNKRLKADRTPFNSKDKYSVGIYNNNTYMLGAPEIFLKSTKYARNLNNEKIKLSEDDIKKLHDSYIALAKEGSRILCCGQKTNDDFIFIAFIALKDPLRTDIYESVTKAQSAGIQVVMITGDNIETATAIAKDSGIIKSNHDKIMTSVDINNLSDSELKDILPNIAVVARALPSDKLRLVRLSEELGLVAGMTGDGINDAPALKAADVGFAMGSGTDIAKEAADIVITDDNFKSITKAVLYGRTIFESIRKFIVFQLTMNLCAMGISLIGPFVGIENPVTVIQMLWVNIIMDTLGGLAFAGEPALESYMKRKSRSLNEKILNKEMFSQIFITGGYSLTLCIFFIKNKFVRAIFEGKTEIYFLTVFFAMLIFCGIFNSFNARTPSANILSHIAGNKAFLIIMTAVAIIQIMIIYFGGEIFRCVPIDRKSLLIAAMFAFSVIPADILRKLITKKGS
ncbi:MAG: cation-translocating P-type ATPase, partial [Clostridia bacterium]|nr:cation-translocating P-type ATPase [Clostridia bacterium]